MGVVVETVRLGACGGCAPRIVIDEHGHEVSVLVDYSQYLTLLGVLAAQTDRDHLPLYWQSALDGSLVLSD
ncbi:MAG: hypothetical protein ACK2UL_04500 [Anaerolineae bacterium]